MRKAQVALMVLVASSVGTLAQNATPPILETYSGVAPVPSQLRFSPLTQVSTAYGTSYQVNVNSLGQNIVGDAANEPSLCIDPNDSRRLAIGWRQFTNVTSDFRQAGWAYSTNGGVRWAFGGLLETNVFRSDPVLASDANGQFYYLSLQTSPSFQCDLWKSTNGGMSWRRIGPALGGDKAWMAIDTTASPGRGNIYENW